MNVPSVSRLKKKVQKTLYLTPEQSRRLRAIATAALEAGVRPGVGANESEIVATLLSSPTRTSSFPHFSTKPLTDRCIAAKGVIAMTGPRIPHVIMPPLLALVTACGGGSGPSSGPVTPPTPSATPTTMTLTGTVVQLAGPLAHTPHSCTEALQEDQAARIDAMLGKGVASVMSASVTADADTSVPQPCHKTTEQRKTPRKTGR